jgi:hypothetical protein
VIDVVYLSGIYSRNSCGYERLTHTLICHRSPSLSSASRPEGVSGSVYTDKTYFGNDY